MPRPRPAAHAAAISFSLLFCGGCFLERQSVNEPILPEVVQRLQPGKTRAQEVVQWLGAPAEVVQLGHRSAYRFDHTTGKGAMLWLGLLVLNNEDTRADRLWVFFDEKDVLTHYGATFAAGRTEYSMPWEDLHDESREEAQRRLSASSRPQ